MMRCRGQIKGKSQELWMSTVLGTLGGWFGRHCCCMLLCWVETRIITYACTHTDTHRKTWTWGKLWYLTYVKLCKTNWQNLRGLQCYSLSDLSPGYQDLMIMLGIIAGTMTYACLLKYYGKWCINLVIFNTDMDRSALLIIRD